MNRVNPYAVPQYEIHRPAGWLERAVCIEFRGDADLGASR